MKAGLFKWAIFGYKQKTDPEEIRMPAKCGLIA